MLETAIIELISSLGPASVVGLLLYKYASTVKKERDEWAKAYRDLSDAVLKEANKDLDTWKGLIQDVLKQTQ